MWRRAKTKEFQMSLTFSSRAKQQASTGKTNSHNCWKLTCLYCHCEHVCMLNLTFSSKHRGAVERWARQAKNVSRPPLPAPLLFSPLCLQDGGWKFGGFKTVKQTAASHVLDCVSVIQTVNKQNQSGSVVCRKPACVVGMGGKSLIGYFYLFFLAFLIETHSYGGIFSWAESYGWLHVV